MKKILLLISVFMLLFTQKVFAHQKQLININGTDYLLMAGSLNEPVYVDDKSGVDFRAYLANPNDTLNEEVPGAVPVEGLEKTLQVELIAGNKSKILDLTPTDTPGFYEAEFYPTVPTTLTFRFFGTINGTPVNISFVSGGTESDPAIQQNQQLSAGVTRKITAGGFESPAPRDDVGFPEPYVSNFQMTNSLKGLQPSSSGSGTQSLNSIEGKTNLALILAVVSFVLGALATAIWYRKTSK